MASSLSTGHDDDKEYAEELREFVLKLSENPDKEPVASEIEGTAGSTCLKSLLTFFSTAVLQSIYGDTAIRLFRPSEGNGKKPDPDTIRYEATLR